MRSIIISRQLSVGLLIGLLFGAGITHYQYQKQAWHPRDLLTQEAIQKAILERVNSPRPCLVCISDSENDGLISCNEMNFEEKNSIGREDWREKL